MLLEDAVDRFERSGAPFEAAQPRLDLAGSLIAVGRAKEAEREAIVARDRLARMGQPGAARRWPVEAKPGGAWGAYGRVMDRRTAHTPSMLEAAALARIDESGAGRAPKAEERPVWALGDYHGFATQTVWGLGPVLVEACGISPGQRVLDVAAGSGNVAIRAAQAGAHVVASDLMPENFKAGRREAAARGVDLGSTW
jgi:hypothetical protein